jgi:hypothetical protein
MFRPGWRASAALVRGAFRTLVFGQALGQLGDGLTQIAFAQLVVFDIGRGASPGRIAGILAVTLLPFSIVGLIGVILTNGLSSFWPRPLEQFSLKDGAVFLGEVVRRETIPEPGQAFTFYGYRFEILRKSRNKITAIRIRPIAASGNRARRSLESDAMEAG